MKDVWASEAHALLWQSVVPGEAARDISEKYGTTKKLHIYDKTDDTSDSQVMILAAYEEISPYDFSKDCANNGVYSYGEPEQLDLSGNTIYLLNESYGDIIDELSEAGFDVDEDTYSDYVVVMKNIQ